MNNIGELQLDDVVNLIGLGRRDRYAVVIDVGGLRIHPTVKVRSTDGIEMWLTASAHWEKLGEREAALVHAQLALGLPINPQPTKNGA